MTEHTSGILRHRSPTVRLHATEMSTA